MPSKDAYFKENNDRAVSHGAFRYLKSGELPAGCEDIQTGLDELRRGVVNDLGGPEVMTSAQELIVAQIVTMTGFIWIIERWALIHGPIVEVKDKDGNTIDGNMAGVFRYHLAAVNSVSRLCALLGLHKARSFESATPLERYMNEHEDKNGKEKG